MPRAATFESNKAESEAAAADRALQLEVATNGHAEHAAADGQVAPPRALEPKVLVPYNPGPGKTPRKIVIERQKRLFSLQARCRSPTGVRPPDPWGLAVARVAVRGPGTARRPPNGAGALRWQDINQLLLDLGVDSAAPEREGAMPLELFDDTEYESRSLDEWLSLGGIGAGGFLPAKCLVRAEDGEPAGG